MSQRAYSELPGGPSAQRLLTGTGKSGQNTLLVSHPGRTASESGSATTAAAHAHADMPARGDRDGARTA